MRQSLMQQQSMLHQLLTLYNLLAILLANNRVPVDECGKRCVHAGSQPLLVLVQQHKKLSSSHCSLHC